MDCAIKKIQIIPITSNQRNKYAVFNFTMFKGDSRKYSSEKTDEGKNDSKLRNV